MPDLEFLTREKRVALRSASATLARGFEGTFGTGTIELFLTTSYDRGRPHDP